jgi:exopolyphosphatase/guanosine-5'-triphosphate,3'-diphosphate pyrophosphatase
MIDQTVQGRGTAMAPTFAALDLGTTNCRLLIASPTPHGFRVLDSYSRIVRLGEGLQSSGRLSEAAMDRTIGALHACAARIGRRRLRGLRAVATEACRRAENGQAFLDRVRLETGLAIDVISTREEAELALESCAALLHGDLSDALVTDEEPADAQVVRQRGDLRPRAAVGDRNGPGTTRDRALLFDIGGGSTEIAWIRVGDDRTRPQLAGYESLPLGVITLAEMFGDEAYTPSGYEAMVQTVTRRLHDFEAVHCIRREVERGGVRVLGTSGTVTTLASVVLDLPRYRRTLVDGIVLTRQAASDAIARLRAIGPEGLRLHPCVGLDRTASVLPGCAIFEAIHRLWPSDGVVVADRGLRDGMLLRMMRDHPTPIVFPSHTVPRALVMAAGGETPLPKQRA